MPIDEKALEAGAMLAPGGTMEECLAIAKPIILAYESAKAASAGEVPEEAGYIIGGIDVRDPDFDNTGKCHDWRNHVGWRTVDIWHEFSDRQKRVLALDAQDTADCEEWE